jgi:hypothetical protein
MEQKETFEFERVLVSCLRRLSRRNTRETIVWVHGSFALLLSPLFSGHVSNPKREPQGINKMGRYQTEAAYLKSVLLWLQGNWTEPDPPRLYSLRAVPQVSAALFHPKDSRGIKPTRRDSRSARVLATPDLTL